MKRKKPFSAFFRSPFALFGFSVFKGINNVEAKIAFPFPDIDSLRRWSIVLVFSLAFAAASFGQTNTLSVSANTNWNTPAAWSLGHIPLATEDAVVTGSTGNVIITVNVASAVCKSLVINQGSRSVALDLNGNTLNVTNGISLNAPTAGNPRATTLIVGAGTVNCASVSAADAGNATRTNAITISSGSLNVSGSLTMGATAACNSITCTGTGLIKIGGAFSTGTFSCGTGTVNYNGSGAQTAGSFTYHDMILSGSGVKTTTGITVNNLLSMEGTATASAAPTYGATATLQYKGSAMQTTGPEFTASVYNLIIDNSSGIALTGSKTVTNTLTMTQGDVTTGANTLALSNGLVGSLTRVSGTVIGKLKRTINTTLFTDYLFPVGTAAFYRPATMSFSSIASQTDITAEFIPDPPGAIAYTDGVVDLSNTFTEGYWRFFSSGLPAVNYSLKLTGNGFTSFTVNEITRITGRDNGNATWRAMGAHSSQSGNDVSRGGVTNLNTTSFDFAFATGCINATMGYDKERDITLDYTKVAGGSDLSNFPVLISLTGQTYLKYYPAGDILNANGYDIIFTDNSYNKLDHQIEYFNGVNGDLIAWVRIPTLSSTGNTVIRILYGNSQIATNPSVTSVWDSHYKGVWHLDDNNLNDFTSFNKSGTPFNSPTYLAGSIYNSLGLSGTNQYVTVINDPNINFNGNITVSAWAYMNTGGLDQKITGNQNNSSGGYKFGIYTNNKVEFEIRNSANTPSLNRTEPGGTVLSTGTWYYLAGMSSDVLDSIKTFVNGIPERPFKKTGILGTASNDLVVGREPFTGSFYFNGRIDELRISDEVRSNGWLRTEYNNQSSPSTFYSVDASETLSNNLPSVSFCSSPITLTFRISIRRSLFWSTKYCQETSLLLLHPELIQSHIPITVAAALPA